MPLTRAPPARAADSLIRAGIGHHEQVNRQSEQAGYAAQRPQAGGQQGFLIVRGHYDADRLDHAKPVACATDGGTPSAGELAGERADG